MRSRGGAPSRPVRPRNRCKPGAEGTRNLQCHGRRYQGRSSNVQATRDGSRRFGATTPRRGRRSSFVAMPPASVQRRTCCASSARGLRCPRVRCILPGLLGSGLIVERSCVRVGQNAVGLDDASKLCGRLFLLLPGWELVGMVRLTQESVALGDCRRRSVWRQTQDHIEVVEHRACVS